MICYKTPLVFMPGWGFKSSIWQTIANKFPDDSVIMLDFPPSVPGKTFHTNSVNEITLQINKQLPNDCILAAWSLSGIIAINLCLMFPAKYQKLAMIASTPKFIQTSDWPGISQTDITKFYSEARSNPSALTSVFQRLIAGQDRGRLTHTAIQSHAIESSQQNESLFYLDMLIQSDMREPYQQLRLPVLNIFGDHDYIIPFRCAETLKNEYPQHATRLISGAGHIPFLTHTHEFMQYLLDFTSLP